MGNEKTNLTITTDGEELTMNGNCSARDLVNVMELCLMELDKRGARDLVIKYLMENRTKEGNTNE